MKSERSDQINDLAMALAKAQGAIKTAVKDAEAIVKTKSGSTFSYKYATLETIWDVCREPLAQNELAVVQIPISDPDDGFCLETILIHSSGQWIGGRMMLPVTSGRMSELQAMGSAITYARRYMLSSVVGVAIGGDDDGHAASEKQNNYRHWAEDKDNRLHIAKILGDKGIPIEHLFQACGAEDWDQMSQYKGTGKDAVAAAQSYSPTTEPEPTTDDDYDRDSDQSANLPDTDGMANLPT